MALLNLLVKADEIHTADLGRAIGQSLCLNGFHQLPERFPGEMKFSRAPGMDSLEVAVVNYSARASPVEAVEAVMKGCLYIVQLEAGEQDLRTVRAEQLSILEESLGIGFSSNPELMEWMRVSAFRKVNMKQESYALVDALLGLGSGGIEIAVTGSLAAPIVMQYYRMMFDGRGAGPVCDFIARPVYERAAPQAISSCF
ncbi:hypothetical protein HYY72_05710 [Candidatus Woesearchaeota archaeon]|nr:hypothetical protein [Candidatus Woesearchaeota archaeon]